MRNYNLSYDEVEDSFPDPDPDNWYYYAHERATIHDDVVIGHHVKIWQYASVIRGAKIGDHTKIASCAIVDASTIGKRCIVSHGAFIDPGMVIGDDVFIGPHVAFCNDIWPRTSKADYDFAAIVRGDFVITEVGNGASIGAGATIYPGVTIGEEAMVAAGAHVRKDLPAHHLLDRFGITHLIEGEAKITRVRFVRRVLPVAAE